MEEQVQQAASLLGRRGAGIPRKLSDEERARRADSARVMTANRIAKAEGRKVVSVKGRLVVTPAPTPVATLVTIKGR